MTQSLKNPHCRLSFQKQYLPLFVRSPTAFERRTPSTAPCLTPPSPAGPRLTSGPLRSGTTCACTPSRAPSPSSRRCAARATTPPSASTPSAAPSPRRAATTRRARRTATGAPRGVRGPWRRRRSQGLSRALSPRPSPAPKSTAAARSWVACRWRRRSSRGPSPTRRSGRRFRTPGSRGRRPRALSSTRGT